MAKKAEDKIIVENKAIGLGICVNKGNSLYDFLNIILNFDIIKEEEQKAILWDLAMILNKIKKGV